MARTLNVRERFWLDFLATRPADERPERPDSSFRFGVDPADARPVAELALAGTKTATGSLLWSYEHDGETPPRIGDLGLVLDERDEPVCVIETTEIRVLPFDEVDARFAWDGGEDDRSLASWRTMYWDYVVRECARIGREASRRVPLVCERFRVVYPRAMSEHRARIEWTRETDAFTYDGYDRSHTWAFEGGVVVPASAAPAYRGSPERVDPEEAFVASLSSCHMLTFLAIAARKRLVVDAYRDEAVGFMEKNEDGRLAITRVVLHPKIEFGGTPPEPDVVARMHHLAHEQCFIANSVRTDVRVEPAA